MFYNDIVPKQERIIQKDLRRKNMEALRPKPHERVRAAMEMTGYNTYEKMSKAIGISLSAFTQKISGNREFTLNECNLIAKTLGKTLDDIFFTTDVPK
jgi:DNA-binding XRE family transcriptional regulator